MRPCREVSEVIGDREASGGAAPDRHVRNGRKQSPDDNCGVSGPHQAMKPEEGQTCPARAPRNGMGSSSHGGCVQPGDLLVLLGGCHCPRQEVRAESTGISSEGSLPKEEAWVLERTDPGASTGREGKRHLDPCPIRNHKHLH